MDNLPVLLRAREDELSAIYENVPGIVFYISVEPDGEFRFLSVSRDFLVATGLTRQQIVGSLVRNVIPPPSRDMVLNHYREAILSSQTVRWEEESVYPAGRRYGEVAVTPLYDASGVATHLIGIVHDITERKCLEESLRESEERLALAARTAGVGVFDHDFIEDRTVWSPEFCRLLGVPEGTTATIADFVNIIHPDDRTRFIGAAAGAFGPQGNGRYSAEIRICRADTGETRWMATSCQPFFEGIGDARRAVRTAGTLIDITERKIREGHYEFVSSLSLVWMGEADVPTLVRTVTDAITRHLGVNRVTIAVLTPDASVVSDLTDSSASPAEGGYQLQSYLNDDARADLAAGRSVVVNDVSADSRTAFACDQYLADGVRAVVIMPLLGGAALKAMLKVDSPHQRTWRPGEVLLLRHVAARLWSAIERVRTEDALRRSEERHEFLLRLSDALRPLSDPLEMQNVASRFLGEYLQVNRVSCSDIEGEDFIVRVSYANGVAPSAGRGSISALGAALLEAYRSGNPIAVDDIRTDPRITEDERARLLAKDIVAFASVVLVKASQWVSSFCVHNARPRAWTRAEIEIMSDVAERTWEAVERARAEKALKEREQRLRLALDASTAGIWTFDPRTNLLDWDDVIDEQYGYPSGYPRRFDTWFPSVHEEDQPRVLAQLDHLLRSGENEWNITFRIRKTDGTEAWIYELGRAERGSDGQVIRMIGISLDVTERRRAEEALEASRAEQRDRALREKGEQALRRSHAELEQRTLQLSRLASQLTLAEQHAREQLARTLHDGLQQQLFTASLALERVAKSGSRADQQDMLQKARAEINEAVKAARTLSVNLFPPILHTGGLPVALSWLAKRTQEQYGVVVSVTADPQANPTASDTRVLLFEAVRELLFNAVKHAHVHRVDVNLAVEPDGTIEIQVSDEGIGFDPAVTLHQGHRHELGLGLFSIQERLALLGGHLDIRSAPGKGARFRLALPRTDLSRLATGGEEAQQLDSGWQNAYEPASGTAKPLRILIADDHAVVRAGLIELLSERSELQVVGEAADGVETISQAKVLQPDVVVMDVSMPHMNGIEATREIHSTLPHIQIVGLSTYSDEATELSMREAGAQAYFSKTENSHRLIDYLISLLTKAKGASAD